MLERKVISSFEYSLLGKDKEGVEYYLERPHWDCGWYWGFGYIETFNENYTDIDSHQHARDFYPKWVLGENSILVDTPFTSRELWVLAEYFKEFYIYKEIAEAYYTGNFGITVRVGTSLKNLDKWKETNNFIKNKIINPIMNIVTGKYEKIKTHFRSNKEFEEYIKKYNDIYYLIQYEFDYNNEINAEFIKVKSFYQNLWEV